MNLLDKKSLFMVYSDIPWDWSADYARQTCIELAKRDTVFCFIWHNTLSIKEYLRQKNKRPILFRRENGVWVFEPLYWLPLKRFHIIQKANFFLNVWIFNIFGIVYGYIHNINNRIAWIFHPYFGKITDNFRWGRTHLVFDLVDNFIGAVDEDAKKELENLERKLAMSATVIATNSHYLQYQVEQLVARKVYLVPQGFDLREFESTTTTASTIINSRAKPVIGYAGGINHRLDYDLLQALASKHPEWEFWFWGRVQEDGEDTWLRKWHTLIGLPNVRTGSANRRDLGNVYAFFDVGIIPYRLASEFNRFCHPMKIFEYFYFGIPCVSVEINELTFPEYKSYVTIASSYKDWSKAIGEYIQHPFTKKQKKLQRSMAIQQSWQRKIEMILEHL